MNYFTGFIAGVGTTIGVLLYRDYLGKKNTGTQRPPSQPPAQELATVTPVAQDVERKMAGVGNVKRQYRAI